MRTSQSAKRFAFDFVNRTEQDKKTYKGEVQVRLNPSICVHLSLQKGNVILNQGCLSNNDRLISVIV